jgi:hypothetical protein
MLRSSALPWRSAFFICVSHEPPEQVYQLELVVRVVAVRRNCQPVGAKALLSTLIWLAIA